MKRSTIVSLCTITSIIGIFFSLLIVYVLLETGVLGFSLHRESLHPPMIDLFMRIFGTIIAALILFSWVALFIMCSGWERNEKVDYFWVKYGTISGAICIIIFNIFSLFVSPAILLAIHVRKFHLGFTNESSNQPTNHA